MKRFTVFLPATMMAAVLLLAAQPALASPASETEHVVKDGETLGGIANRTGVSASTIARANGLKEPYAVRVGQKLKIPRSGGASNSKSSAATGNYVVKEGDTLSGIANRAGVPRIVIAEANRLKEPYEVRSGQTLVIPRQRTHVVKKGETGFDIAYQYGIIFDKIAVANGLASGARLRPGQKLVIPAITRADDSPAAPVASPAVAATPAPVAAAPVAPAPAATAPVARFRWPLAGSVNQGFNPTEAGQSHNGIDIAATDGEPVKAAAGGIVIFAAYEKTRFGNLVIIDHGDRWHTAYGHLSKITARKGAGVKSGEAIGLAGSSGPATTPELHFEIRHLNKPIDPQAVLGPPR